MKNYQFALVVAAAALSGCTAAPIDVHTPDGEIVSMTFYPGSSATKVDDLLIIGDKNYFGKVGFQMDDPLGDISFRFLDGKRIQAECAESGENSIGKPECKSYRVYRSEFDMVPVDSIVPRPKLF